MTIYTSYEVFKNSDWISNTNIFQGDVALLSQINSSWFTRFFSQLVLFIKRKYLSKCDRKRITSIYLFLNLICFLFVLKRFILTGKPKINRHESSTKWPYLKCAFTSITTFNGEPWMNTAESTNYWSIFQLKLRNCKNEFKSLIRNFLKKEIMKNKNN